MKAAKTCQVWCLKPVIPAEAGGSLWIGGQPGAHSETLSQKTIEQKLGITVVGSVLRIKQDGRRKSEWRLSFRVPGNTATSLWPPVKPASALITSNHHPLLCWYPRYPYTIYLWASKAYIAAAATRPEFMVE